MARYIAAIVKKAITFFNMRITSPDTDSRHGFGQVGFSIRFG